MKKEMTSEPAFLRSSSIKENMKPRVFMLILVGSLPLYGCSSWGISHPALHDELMQMMKRDQSARTELMAKGFDRVDSLDAVRLASVDSANTHRLQQIIEENGWPYKDQVGTKGVGAAFLILQHADHAFQKKMLPLVQEIYEQGGLKGEHLALLTDRVLVGDGKAQLYGTQAKVVDGSVQFFPIEDEMSIDERRAELGLRPLAKYRKIMERMYGVEDRDANGE